MYDANSQPVTVAALTPGTCSRLCPSAPQLPFWLSANLGDSAFLKSAPNHTIPSHHPTPLPFLKYSYRHSHDICLLSAVPIVALALHPAAFCFFVHFLHFSSVLIISYFFRLEIHLNNHDGRNHYSIHRVMLTTLRHAGLCSYLLAIPCFNKA